MAASFVELQEPLWQFCVAHVQAWWTTAGALLEGLMQIGALLDGGAHAPYQWWRCWQE